SLRKNNHHLHMGIVTMKSQHGMHQHGHTSYLLKLLRKFASCSQSLATGNNDHAITNVGFHTISSKIFCSSLSVFVSFSLQKAISSEALFTFSVSTSTSISPDSIALTMLSNSFFAVVNVSFSILLF